MMSASDLKAIDWGYDVESIQNSSGYPLFKRVELNWTRPVLWPKEQSKPDFDGEDPFLYALIKNHGNSKTRDRIVYVGLTKSPKTRFGNHKTAKAIVSQNGTVKFSYAKIDFIKGRDRIARIGLAMEEIEHLLIWAMGDDLQNERKQYTLPGLGTNGGNAWHIQNTGYRFSGRLPVDIVYPWMAIRPGRNKSAKTKAD